MTCVVGMTNGTDVVLVADSMGSNGFTGGLYRGPKCFVSKNDSGPSIVVGFAGSFRYGQLLEQKLKPPRDGYTDLWVDFVDAVRAVLKEHGALSKEENAERADDGVALVGWGGRLFRFQQDFSLLEPVRPYCTVGSGGYHADGYLWAELDHRSLDVSDLDRGEMIGHCSNAIRCAADFVVSVDGRNLSTAELVGDEG